MHAKQVSRRLRPDKSVLGFTLTNAQIDHAFLMTLPIIALMAALLA